MIGFFDSGFGGLTILKEVVKILPQYSYIYLGDNLRTPYGSRNQNEIYKFTTEGISELFTKGVNLIVLACNTSSSSALRKIQQEFLPANFPMKKVLGIIIPTAEEIANFTTNRGVGILATEATVASRSYTDEIKKADKKITVYQQACPLFVPMIEAGKIDGAELEAIAKKYLDQLFAQDSEIDAVILGCTHYAIIENIIRKLLPTNVKLISQGKIVAEKLKDYLQRHPEIDLTLEKNDKRIFLTTKESKKVEHLAELFYGEPLDLEVVKL